MVFFRGHQGASRGHQGLFVVEAISQNTYTSLRLSKPSLLQNTLPTAVPSTDRIKLDMFFNIATLCGSPSSVQLTTSGPEVLVRLFC